MNDTSVRCQLCGEPMPAGEEMFKYHGYSGNCPKPSKIKGAVRVRYILRDEPNGEFWFDVEIDGGKYETQHIGPFRSATERQRALDDLLIMTRATGAIDQPLGGH